MSKKETYQAELGGTTSAAGTLTLLSNRLRPGQTLCVQMVALRSTLTDSVVAHVGVLRGSTLARLETVPMTTGGYTYVMDHEVWIESDAQLQVDFTAGGNSIPTQAWIFGYLQDDL